MQNPLFALVVLALGGCTRAVSGRQDQVLGRVQDLSVELTENLKEDILNCRPGYKEASHWPKAPVWKPWSLSPDLITHFPNPQSSTLDPAKFHLHIKLLTYDRVSTTARFLDSLKKAQYLGDSVSLQVFIDNPYSARDGWGKKKPQTWLEALKAHKAMVHLINKFDWPHGTKTVHARAVNSGVQPQWMEAWWPDSVNEFAFIAEDDLEISPFFYIYLKRTLLHFYYNQSNFDPSVYGISFQRQYLVPGYHGNKMSPPLEPFLYQLVGTWGQILFPILWKDYRMWYDENRYTPGRDPSIGNMQTSNFWRIRRNVIWTPWQVWWVHVRHVYNIYTGFPERLALSVSHRTSGVNMHTTLGPDAPLMTLANLTGNLNRDLSKDGLMDVSTDPSPVLPLWWTSMPDMRSMKRFDWCFRQVPPLAEPVRSLGDLKAVLPEFSATSSLAIIPLSGTPQAYNNARNLLCHMDGLGLHNYMFLFSLLPTSPDGPALAHCNKVAVNWNQNIEKQAKDLARRGHLVYVSLATRGLAPNDCTDAASAERKRSILSLSQAEAIGEVLKVGPSILVSTLGAFWGKDPFKCVSDVVGKSPVRAWAFREEHAPPGKLGFGSLLAWFESSTQGTQRYAKFLEQWRGLGGNELTNLPRNASVQLETSWGLEVLDNKVTNATSCVSTNWREKNASVILSGTDYRTLMSSGLWKLDDNQVSCKAVVCQKKD